MSDEAAYDWADDESLSAEETMRIFEALPGPDIEITGPPEQGITTSHELGQPHVTRTYVSSITHSEDVRLGAGAKVAMRPHALLTA